MKNLFNKKRQEGFTIIEVMIVLAIAAVILLIVLLAVPALQRANRNTQRNNDAAQIAAAVNTCMANHNALVTSCSGLGPTQVDLDLTKLGQLSDTPTFGGGGAGTTTGAVVTFGDDCSADGTTTAPGASTKQFAITYQLEASGGGLTPRCISS